MAAPVVNIDTSGAFGLTNITTCEDATNWYGFTISSPPTPSATRETDIFIQGSAATSAKITGTLVDKGIWYDVGSGNEIDFTVSGRHLHIWVALTTIGIAGLMSQGGIYIAASTSGNVATDYIHFYVNGSDTLQDGRFVRYVVDLTKTPSRSVGSTTLSSIRYIGAGCRVSGSIKSENLIIDSFHYGDGLQIESGDSTTPCTWKQLYDLTNTNSTMYGIIGEESGVYFLRGGLTIGDPTGTVTTLWDDSSGDIVRFENPEYYNGDAMVSQIDASNLYKIELVGNSTGTTTISWGTVLGTGDTRQGIKGGGISSDGPKWELDAETDISNLSAVNLYGMRIQGAGFTKFSGSTKTDIIGTSFIECDEVQPNDAEFLNNFIIAPIPDRGLEMTSSHNIERTSFIAGSADDQGVDWAWQVDATGPTYVDETEDFNDADAGDCLPFPASEAIGDYFAMGHRQKFKKLEIDTGTARSGGTLVWEYYNGSTWSSLTVTDGTNTLSTTGLQSVTWTPPTNWAKLSLHDEDPVYYVRLRVTATMTTNPIIDQGNVADTVEHHLHIPAAGTYTLENLYFFGHSPTGASKWHGENSGASAAVTLDALEIFDILEGEIENTNSGTTEVYYEVPVKLTVKDVGEAKAPINAARVIIEARSGGDLPFEESVSITRSGSTATVTHTAHGMETNEKAAIRGADQQEYNGIFPITVVDADSYTYTVAGVPATPATGTITSTGIILEGITNASGIIERTDFHYTSTQPIGGYARKASSAPYYKSLSLGGAISTVGLDYLVYLIPDQL